MLHALATPVVRSRPMAGCSGRRPAPYLVCVVWALAIVAGGGESHAQFTPDSPEVRRAVERGLAYLASTSKVGDSRLGAKALAGLAFLKNGQREHACVAEAVAAIRKRLENRETLEPDQYEIDAIYSLGLSLVFLCELGDSAYRGEIEQLVYVLSNLQKPFGGWGYAGRTTSDTSMTQNAVLGLWSAGEMGVHVPIETMERACQWLLETQDPNGAWGYQGKIGEVGKLVEQSEVRSTMALAGLGSLYLCAVRLAMLKIESSIPDRPPQLVRMEDAARRGEPRPFTAKNVDQALARGREWMDLNNEPYLQFMGYYYYSLERYQTLVLLADPRRAGDHQWYDKGCQDLIARQQQDGSWNGGEGPVPATAFCILFMVRSTQKAIERFVGLGAGTLVGGRGLPSDESDVRLRMGRLVSRPLLGPAEDLFNRLRDPTDSSYLQAAEALKELRLDNEKEDALNRWERELLRLAEGDSPAAKAAALEALAKTRDLDYAPVLIEALRDTNAEVYQAAKDGLQFMRRDLTAKLVPGRPSDDEIEAEIRRWRAWYRTIKPDAVFDE